MPTYLKSIEMTGFKSFAAKTRVEFSEGITGIVGPNGCGKSNVVEAVKWVLGEQSAKSLRGEKMEDVIFNGSRDRNALGMADVNLTFNNESKWLSADFTEISISRRIFRSGEGQYYINRSRVRLKDVVELFLDTGVGKDSYAIFEQGKIDRLLSESPVERRSLFEDFAGISKFKFRREDAERKLSHSKTNLDRVEDVIGELARELQSLKKQAEDAGKYNEMRKELRELEISFEALRVANLTAEIEKRLENKKNLEEKLSPLSAELKKTEDGILSTEEQIGSLETEFAKKNEILHNAERNLAEVASRLRADNERKIAIGNQLEEMESRLKSQGERAEGLKAELIEKGEMLKKAEKERNSFSEKLSKMEGLLDIVREKMENLNQETLEKSKAIGLTRIVRKDDIEDQQRKLYSAQANLENYRNTVREKHGVLSEQQRRKEERDREAELLHQKVIEVKSSLERYIREIDKNLSEENELKEDSKQKNAEIRKLQTELKSMDKVIMQSLEKQSEELKNFSLKKPLFEARLESAVEGLNQSLDSGDASETRAAVDRLKTIFDEYRGYYENILGILYSDEGTYTRKENLEERTEELTEGITKNSIRLEALSAKLKELQTIRSDLQSKYSRLDVQHSTLKKESERLEHQIEKSREEVMGLENLINSTTAKINDAQSKIDKMNSIVDEYEKSVSKLREEKAEQSEKISSVKIDFARAEEQFKSYKNEVRRIETQISDIEKMQLDFDNDRTKQLAQIEDLEKREISDTASRDDLSEKIESYRNEIEILREKMASLTASKKVLEKSLQDISFKINRIELDIEEKSRIASEKQEILSSAVSKTLETYGVDVREKSTEGLDSKEISADITNLRRQITRLGDVNMLAIEQYQEAEERMNFLISQKEDILHAMAGIESLIAETNEKSIEQFMRAFEDIRSAFKRMFKRLFDGGRADMQLMDPAKPLECGIEILAEPPGTKFKSVSLLSGGQRAMVAIAIVFAILYLKPTPFVILDELDAPLDDDNIERFKKLLTEFRGESQFVVVSHSKSTLEVCDVLYGVTMEEQGVSKVVNVAFDDAQLLFKDMTEDDKTED